MRGWVPDPRSPFGLQHPGTVLCLAASLAILTNPLSSAPVSTGRLCGPSSSGSFSTGMAYLGILEKAVNLSTEMCASPPSFWADIPVLPPAAPHPHSPSPGHAPERQSCRALPPASSKFPPMALPVQNSLRKRLFTSSVQPVLQLLPNLIFFKSPQTDF